MKFVVTIGNQFLRHFGFRELGWRNNMRKKKMCSSLISNLGFVGVAGKKEEEKVVLFVFFNLLFICISFHLIKYKNVDFI